MSVASQYASWLMERPAWLLDDLVLFVFGVFFFFLNGFYMFL